MHIWNSQTNKKTALTSGRHCAEVPVGGGGDTEGEYWSKTDLQSLKAKCSDFRFQNHKSIPILRQSIRTQWPWKGNCFPKGQLLLWLLWITNLWGKQLPSWSDQLCLLTIVYQDWAWWLLTLLQRKVWGSSLYPHLRSQPLPPPQSFVFNFEQTVHALSAKVHGLEETSWSWAPSMSVCGSYYACWVKAFLATALGPLTPLVTTPHPCS